MLSFFTANGEALARRDSEVLPEQAGWIDLLNPSPEEEKEIEKALGLDVPTREELHEIEASSRLYHDGDAWFMTANVLMQGELEKPVTTAVTFILVGKRLVTVRYAEPRAFLLCRTRLKKGEAAPGGGIHVLVTLLETIIDRTADMIERVQADVDRVGRGIFGMRGGVATRQKRLDVTLQEVGREGEIVSRCRDSLYSLGRLLSFLAFAMQQNGKEDKSVRVRVRTAQRDVSSLADHIAFLSSKITFLLDATLGMISIQQANIIKIFSVAAVVFLPPTLVASIYGMNFETMPELRWAFGYPAALVLMVLAAVLPYLYFKRRGWL